MLIIEVEPEAFEGSNQSVMSAASTGGSAARRSEGFTTSGVSRKEKNKVKLATGVTASIPQLP